MSSSGGRCSESLHDEAVRLLLGWRAPDERQESLRRGYLRHLAAHEDAVWRSGPPIHLTASCFVLDPTGSRTLLTLHRKGGFWVQFGGHCEPGDRDLAATAVREAREESGLAGLTLAVGPDGDPVPVDLDAHDLPTAFGRCARHLDVAFAAVAVPGAAPRVSTESLDVAWFDLAALPAGVVPDLPGRLASARRRLLGPAFAPQSPVAGSAVSGSAESGSLGAGSVVGAGDDVSSAAAESRPSRNPRARSVRG